MSAIDARLPPSSCRIRVWFYFLIFQFAVAASTPLRAFAPCIRPADCVITLMRLSADVGHFYNMKRKNRGRTATNYFVGGSIGGMLGSGGFGNGSGFRDYMNGGGIFGSGRSQSYMGPAHNPGMSSYSGYGADVPGGSGGGGGGDTFGAGGCSHFNGGRC
jgi:hypothetical protein